MEYVNSGDLMFTLYTIHCTLLQDHLYFVMEFVNGGDLMFTLYTIHCTLLQDRLYFVMEFVNCGDLMFTLYTIPLYTVTGPFILCDGVCQWWRSDVQDPAGGQVQRTSSCVSLQYIEDLT